MYSSTIVLEVIVLDKKDELKLMIEHPEYIMEAEKKTLNARIEQKKIDSEGAKKLATSLAKSQGKSLVSDVLNGKWADLVFDIADTGDKLKAKLEDMKKIMLLGEYVQKVDDQEQGLRKIIDLITNPYGLSIYSKMINILVDAPVDDDMVDIMSDYLKQLTDEEDLSRAFSRHKTILSLIDKCSTQALILLRNADQWPVVPFLGASVVLGGRVQGDNTRAVAEAFVQINLFSSLSINDVQMAVTDLETNGLARFLSGHPNNNPLKTVYMEKPTEVGEILKNAITK